MTTSITNAIVTPVEAVVQGFRKYTARTVFILILVLAGWLGVGCSGREMKPHLPCPGSSSPPRRDRTVPMS